jgi:CRISPR system Cascade subunit CasA
MMDQNVPNRFNLVDEKWIPVANEGLVSLHDVFTNPHLTALGGNPVQKIALTKLFLAIAQSAYTPKDDEDWKQLGADGMAAKALEYLKEKRDCFWLYGEKPFLQMPVIRAMIAQRKDQELRTAKTGAKVQEALENANPKPIGSGHIPDLPSENNTVLTQVGQIDTDAEKAIFLITLMNFALGGKRVEKGLPPLSKECTSKTDSAKAGPSIGNHWGYLQSFLHCNRLRKTIWLNVLTQENVGHIAYWTTGIGVAPWETMPESEVCQVATALKNSYMGCLLGLCRFVLLEGAGIFYLEGIQYPSHKNGWREPSMSILEESNGAKILWVDPNKRPWRSLTSILSFMSSTSKRGFDCQLVSIGLNRARRYGVESLGLWSGGLKVRANAGDQSAKGDDDYVESEFLLESFSIGESWYMQLSTEMTVIEALADNVFACTKAFYKKQKAAGKDQARQASSLFWQLAEQYFQTLINACGTQTSATLRPVFANLAIKAFDTYCPRDTARQLDAWAACRPQLGKYFSPEFAPKISTLTPAGA